MGADGCAGEGAEKGREGKEPALGLGLNPRDGRIDELKRGRRQVCFGRDAWATSLEPGTGDGAELPSMELR